MQRKVFRIERMFVDKDAQRASPLRANARGPVGPQSQFSPINERTMQELKRELDAIYSVIDKNRRALESLHAHTTDGPRVARAQNALGAAIGGMEQATQKILNAAENIDERARALHAGLKNDYECGLAQDIQDQIVGIYEACNFQDLSGQHITQAMDTLKFVEEHVARMMAIWGDIGPARAPERPAAEPTGRTLANGPKIEGDAGHVSQSDVDNIFEFA